MNRMLASVSHRTRTLLPSIARASLAGLLLGSALPGSAHACVEDLSRAPTVGTPGVGGDHVVLRSCTGADRVPLFVWLPGSHGQPGNSLNVLHTALGAGYRVIGLSYDTGHVADVNETCDGSLAGGTDRASSEDCFVRVRNEVVFNDGGAPPGFDVAPGDSVAERLEALLGELAVDDPAGGWTNLWDGGELVTTSIVVAGFSAGAGSALWLAHEAPFRGVVLIDGVKDHFRAPGASGFAITPLPAAQATSGDRHWGITHKQFGASATGEPTGYAMMLAQWSNLGVPARPDILGAAATQATHSRGLVSPCARRFHTDHACGASHKSMAIDGFMPADLQTCTTHPAGSSPTTDFQLYELYRRVFRAARVPTDPSCPAW